MVALGDHAATVRVLRAEITHAPPGRGYATGMLAVVVLLPIVIMLSALLLERYEARTTRVAPPRTSRADLRLPPSRPAPAAPAGARLALVAHPEDTPSTGEPTQRTGTEDTAGLRRAS